MQTTHQELTTVLRDEEHHIEFHWHGGHTVNIYVGGLEVDVFTMGMDAPATYEDLVESCTSHLADMLAEYDDD